MQTKPAAERTRQTRLRRALSLFATVVAMGYLVGLVCSILAFRWVGERSWLVVVAMYLPRLGFAAPLPVVLVAAALWAPRWVLATQALSSYLVLFPLMGLKLGLERLWVASDGPRIRIVSYNIHDGAHGLGSILAQTRGFSPDVVLLQEVYPEVVPRLRAAFTGWNVHFHEDLFVASRWPMRDAYVPPSIRYDGRRSGRAHFVRYSLATPLGAVDVFNIHPISPREGFDELRGSGARGEVGFGRLFAGIARGPIESNALRRRRQVEGIAASARASSRPVIIAGDSNLPDLSWVLGENLGDFRDGFSSVGRGFGYTFPTKHPWLRLDRIMTNEKLRVTGFSIGKRDGSDHLCVFATIGSGG